MLEDWSVSRMQSLIRRSAFSPYRSISTAIPNHWLPSDPWKGQAVLGQPLASGSHPKEITPDHWHDFSWLRHMREYGGNQARTLARRFITEWIDQHQRWSQEIWHPQLLSTRLKKPNLGLGLVWRIGQHLTTTDDHHLNGDAAFCPVQRLAQIDQWQQPH